MYTVFLQIHQYLSWLLLLISVYAVLRSWYSFIFRRWWSRADAVTGMAMTIIFDLQLTAGLILYAGLSPVTKGAFATFSEAIRDPAIRFYAVEHILLMVFAVILVHAGSSRARKAQFPARKQRISAIFYTLALVLVLARIPWERIFAI